MANDDFKQAQTLDIPNGTTFEFKDGKLIFGHESDIVIRTNMGGYKFQKIYSKKGSVQVMPPAGVEFDVDEIEAVNGDVFLNGRVRVRSVRAKTIHFQEGALVAERLDATTEAVLSGERVDVLHVKAPRVVLDADSQGAVLLVESDNDIGRFRAHGGFRSADEVQQAFQRFDRLFAGPQRSASVAAGAATASLPRVAPQAAAPSPPPPAARPPLSPSQAAAPVAPTAAAPLGNAGDATIVMPAREQRPESVTTEEFRSPFGAAAGDPDATSVLPKSSVFRKRK